MVFWRPLTPGVVLCLLLTALTIWACGSSTPVSPNGVASTSTSSASHDPGSPDAGSSPLNVPVAPTTPVLSATQTVVAVGDISQCGLPGSGLTAALMTRLLQGSGATGITLGDNSNEDGSRDMVMNCLDPTWGSLKSQLLPSPGNHDYQTDAVNPFYYQYFGAAAGPPGLGYYSFDRGGWHILSLNSELPETMRQAQLDWMTADLKTHRSGCSLAYFHRPLFSSGQFAAQRMKRLWDVLYRAGVDVILNGHEHFYAAFPPMNPDGGPDPSFGIREIVAGTGGARLFARPAATYGETVIAGQWGLLVMRLNSTSYEWDFVSTENAVLDTGRGTCHGAPQA